MPEAKSHNCLDGRRIERLSGGLLHLGDIAGPEEQFDLHDLQRRLAGPRWLLPAKTGTTENSAPDPSVREAIQKKLLYGEWLDYGFVRLPISHCNHPSTYESYPGVYQDSDLRNLASELCEDFVSTCAAPQSYGERTVPQLKHCALQSPQPDNPYNVSRDYACRATAATSRSASRHRRASERPALQLSASRG